MIGVIVLTATATAALVLAITHKRTAYVYRVQELSLQRADEINILTADCMRYVQRLQNEQMTNNAIIKDLTIARQRITDLERYRPPRASVQSLYGAVAAGIDSVTDASQRRT